MEFKGKNTLIFIQNIKQLRTHLIEDYQLNFTYLTDQYQEYIFLLISISHKRNREFRMVRICDRY